MLKNIAKVSLPLILSLSIFSCNNMSTVGLDALKSNSTTQVKYENGIAIIDSGLKGSAKLSFSLNKNINNNFSIKAPPTEPTAPPNTNGMGLGLKTSIQSYKVWLVKNPSPMYPIGGDPIGDSVAGPFILDSPLDGVTFNNIPPSNGHYYSVAVQAFDGMNATGNQLIKQNNGSMMGWSGNTAFPMNRLAVSNGVMVDSDNKVSSTDPLIVTPMLEDGYGARLNSEFKLSPDLPSKQVDKCGGLTPSSYVDTFGTYNSVTGIEIDPLDGSKYILESGLGVKKITKDGTETTFINNSNVTSITIDPNGNFYYSLSGSNVVMKRPRGSMVDSIYAGGGSGSGTEARKSTFGGIGSSSLDLMN
jgi:hypothetical protein